MGLVCLLISLQKVVDNRVSQPMKAKADGNSNSQFAAASLPKVLAAPISLPKGDQLIENITFLLKVGVRSVIELFNLLPCGGNSGGLI